MINMDDKMEVKIRADYFEEARGKFIETKMFTKVFADITDMMVFFEIERRKAIKKNYKVDIYPVEIKCVPFAAYRSIVDQKFSNCDLPIARRKVYNIEKVNDNW